MNRKLTLLKIVSCFRYMPVLLVYIITAILPTKSFALNELESPMEAWRKSKMTTDFSASVLISKDNDVVFEQGFGLSDKENKVNFTKYTVIDILSLTKQFTATAILKLEEQNKLSVNDTIDKFFDNVPEDKKDISLHHLLTHTSGLKANYKYDYRTVTRDEMEKEALTSWLRSEPGEEYRYSNIGYSLLGIIIEKVSNKKYENYLHENLFTPAGMNKTGYRIPDWREDTLAVGYRSRATTFRGYLARLAHWFGQNDRWGTPLDHNWADDGPWWNLRANGGLLSTLNDLHKWHVALEANIILSEKQKNKLYGSYVKDNPDGDTYYGYGWHINGGDEGVREIFHSGGNPYFFSFSYQSVEHGLLLLFFTNDWAVVHSGEFNRLIGAMLSEYAKIKE